MKRIVSALLIIALVILLVFIGETLYFYRGTYTAPPTGIHDLNITVDIVVVTAFADVYNESEGVVLVDRAHDNNVGPDELNVLFSRILSRGNNIEFLEPGNASNISDKLDGAISFVVVSPQEDFTEEEIEQMGRFLNQGGKLLLLSDPQRQSDMNLLSIKFGIITQPHYLYNLKEHDINFRYVFFSDFEQHELTKRLNRITLYVACPILPPEKGIVFADSNTYSSAKEVAEGLTPVVLINRTLAICDQTFLTEPYSSTTDNSQFIANIADWLTSSAKIPEANITETTEENLSQQNGTS